MKLRLRGGSICKKEKKGGQVLQVRTQEKDVHGTSMHHSRPPCCLEAGDQDYASTACPNEGCRELPTCAEWR